MGRSGGVPECHDDERAGMPQPATELGLGSQVAAELLLCACSAYETFDALRVVSQRTQRQAA
jgi:hypothetical protein